MAVKTWICSILLFSIFLSVFLQLLPGKQYVKYVRFFAGLIWILVVMQPVLQLFHLENPVNAQAFAQLKKEADMKVPRRHVELYDTIMGCLGYTSPDGGINDNNNWCHIPQAREAATN